jgi:hypothetical protein
LTFGLEFAETLQSFSTRGHKIKAADLALRYTPNNDDRKSVWNLSDNTDKSLPRSLRVFSVFLTELKFTASHLSPEVFWPMAGGVTDLRWPFLKSIIIRTSHETEDGKYYLLPPDERFDYNAQEPPLEVRDPEVMELMLEDEPDLAIVQEMGLIPMYSFRIRPDHSIFSQWAVAIAQAAQNMPALRLLSFQIQGDTHGRAEESYGFNHIAQQRDGGPPRTDWVFMCPNEQLLGWKQPEEASKLWKTKCGNSLVESIISKECDTKDRFKRQFSDGLQTYKDHFHEHYARYDFGQIYSD